MTRVARRGRAPRNPADFVLTARLREPVRFTDLSERLALKLSALPGYLSRAHFEVWHRRVGAPDFADFRGVFTPLVHVDLAVTDLPMGSPAMRRAVHVRGQTHLGKTLDASGGVRHLAREGLYEVSAESGALVGRARFVNVFTRYDADPARRRVTELPAEMRLGSVPSRLVDVPDVAELLRAAGSRAADLSDERAHVWHYTQTDANRHVNGMEYLRGMEDFVADALATRGHDLRRLYPARARIVYRKPCFRGERYRRIAWLLTDEPPVLVGIVRKEGDPTDAPPAVAIELSFAAHAGDASAPSPAGPRATS
ncbi:hypothetical protein K2Z84_07970 [Candidatus Binatia bacterium]|nr:hypothetical protein [Candidatus Binatia bacterium]